MSDPPRTFPGFTPEALAAFQVPGVAQRWAAIQEQLHPALAALAEQIHEAAARQLPREWPMYEISYKDSRSINRGAESREPIDEYHLAVDRPPRGSGVYVVLSGAERRVLVVLQLGGQRKLQLRAVWEDDRAIFLPLIQRLNDVRFAAKEPRRATQRKSDRQPPSGERAEDGADALSSETWIDRYLAAKSAAYLLAGFSYSWDDPQIGQPGFAEQLVADVLALLPLNEAIMEQVERREPRGLALLREHRAEYRLATPSVDEIVARIAAQSPTFSGDLVRAYHLALQTKPFVILPGISGTGKTRLTRLYADAVHRAGPGEENERYLIVAVQPDWHNARDLLGYYNAITGKFHATPFLRFLVRAGGDPGIQYFVCLDEMNLARPEYYLAPILSAIETDDRLIDLGVPGPTVEAVSGELLSNPLRLPRNLAITGTVNVDESTHPLSDKLLDRANVIELTEVDLEAFRRSWSGQVDQEIWQMIVAIHAISARAGHPFGYRTLTEMLRYLEQARSVLSPARALDQQIKQKILPKLRGEDTPRLRRSLTDFLALALGHPGDPPARSTQVTPEATAAAPLPEAAEKLRRMLARLEADGFTDFYS